MAQTPDSITLKAKIEPEHPRPSCAGPSLLDILWGKLVEAYDDLLTQQWHIENEIRLQAEASEPLGSLQEAVTEDMELARLRGVCLGLATAISIIINPYLPDVDAVRNEVPDRWEAWKK